jgi:hypothetical protein
MITIGDITYRLLATERDGRWVARAAREDTGEPFGVECAAPTAAAAAGRLRAWLTWQHEHAAALASLQAAERAYHRLIAGSAFTHPAGGAAPAGLHKDSLAAVDAARLTLDDVRARMPE